jgi:hypothetical protein
MGGHVACVEAIRNAHKILVVYSEPKRPFGRLRPRDGKIMGCDGADLMCLAQNKDSDGLF